MKIWKLFLVFFAGGWSYVCMELGFRGRSHYSMFVAGGLCLLLIGHLEEVELKLPLPLRILAGAAIITMVELGIGLLANRDYSVWDYRDQWGECSGADLPGVLPDLDPRIRSGKKDVPLAGQHPAGLAAGKRKSPRFRGLYNFVAYSSR